MKERPPKQPPYPTFSRLRQIALELNFSVIESSELAVYYLWTHNPSLTHLAKISGLTIVQVDSIIDRCLSNDSFENQFQKFETLLANNYTLRGERLHQPK